MKIHNAPRRSWQSIVQVVALVLVTAFTLIVLSSKSIAAEDTARDDFIQKCRLLGGSAVTKFQSNDVYCATRPLKTLVVDEP